jgi:hypothetical protein
MVVWERCEWVRVGEELLPPSHSNLSLILYIPFPQDRICDSFLMNVVFFRRTERRGQFFFSVLFRLVCSSCTTPPTQPAVWCYSSSPFIFPFLPQHAFGVILTFVM